jgi:hypothetical protein
MLAEPQILIFCDTLKKTKNNGKHAEADCHAYTHESDNS